MAGTSVYIRDYRTEIPGHLAADRLTWEFPTVRSANTRGRESFWNVYVRLVDAAGRPAQVLDEYFDSAPIADRRGFISVNSGLVGGKTREVVPTYVRDGKNVGKVSATNVWTQALRQALGLYNKQIKKAAAPALVDGVDMYPPMLAKIFSDVNPRVDADHPVFVQRKYNGVRANAVKTPDGRVIMYSRRRNIYPGFAALKEELARALPAGLYLDGEIYSHGVALQDISGFARLADQPADFAYSYVVYDCFDPARPNMLYSERRAVLDKLFAAADLACAVPVETFVVTSVADIDALYAQFIAEEYEGAMIRQNTVYQYSYNDHHSANLLKKKPTLDAEYEIVGWETGSKGKAAAALMMICVSDTGHQFPVTPAMEIAERIALAAKMNTVEPNASTHFENYWLGRPLVVEYDEESKDGVPQRARTRMIIRNWE